MGQIIDFEKEKLKHKNQNTRQKSEIKPKMGYTNSPNSTKEILNSYNEMVQRSEILYESKLV